ncbi:hypothetical protein GUITHDRAFT_155155 [Guillardia theta CCMP2712]|uniref:Uncharacterized protein n=1 Tax=Guillardia theta (strain CCMP2712) TaxID=905079 RepID=L1ILQ0_GUITC|nr:hypothetical protein GUITHDRAFT_155155 [Guillardia theta CCMP2712]EKX36794.1 hypothetical protein GUITHDRAFT_155155 [Guillardia theta CCMP2712]|eukprot:XP_005823774.1 hypothetical protein GUITHDRAFT_155155 [Guillardia theta CCMP2712]
MQTNSKAPKVSVTIVYENFWLESHSKRNLRRASRRQQANEDICNQIAAQTDMLLQSVRAASSKRSARTTVVLSSKWSKYINVNMMSQLDFEI